MKIFPSKLFSFAPCLRQSQPHLHLFVDSGFVFEVAALFSNKVRQVCRAVTRRCYFHARFLGNRLLTCRSAAGIVNEPNSPLGKHLNWNVLLQRKATLQILVIAALTEIGITISLATGLVIVWPWLPGLLGSRVSSSGVTASHSPGDN